MTPSRDPRETVLITAAFCVYTQQLNTLLESGYPPLLAALQVRSLIRQNLGIDLARYGAAIPVPHDEADAVHSVRYLSACFGLEHDGSALNALLERHDYQWRLSNGVWHPTERTQQEGLGFLFPDLRGKPRIMWKPVVCRQVIALEQARQALEAPGEPNLLHRHYRTPRELGVQFGVSTRQVNQRLAQAGYQVRRPYRRGHRWEPTPQARAERAVILCSPLEWRPAMVERVLAG
jgi:hypothetical protein